jgi:hypothetical protein
MRKILLAVALLLLAVTATNAASPARKGGQKSAKTGQRTQQRATAPAPTQAAPKGLPTAAKAAGKPQVAAKGQAGLPAPVGAKGPAPRSFAVSNPGGPVTVNPDGTTTVDLSHNQAALDQLFGPGKVPALPPNATPTDVANQRNAIQIAGINQINATTAANQGIPFGGALGGIANIPTPPPPPAPPLIGVPPNPDAP